MFTRERLTRWTNALRANPEQQITDHLANADLTRFCCLGKLCQIEGLVSLPWMGTAHYKFPVLLGSPSEEDKTLAGDLADEFGSEVGDFDRLGMPRLQEHLTAASANDRGVSWIDIADHFDKYYPCSDEVRETSTDIGQE